MSDTYPKRPNVGDVLEHAFGPVTVTGVLSNGRRLNVLDSIGRKWQIQRAPEGCWKRA